MTNGIIEKYLDTILRPNLIAFSIPDILIATITAEVRIQMLSCMFHWRNTEFRKAILVVGDEEGTFYLPEAETDIRNFVVVTLRNSPIESIHADSYTGKRISSGDLKAITSGAIEYFKDVDFSSEVWKTEALANDKYGDLATKYPVSWKAFTELANSAKQLIEYNPLPVLANPSLSVLKPQKAINGLFFNDNRSKMMHVTADGYSLTVDHGLIHIIQSAVENELPFVCDSFKGVSRNIEKLLAVMEYILGSGLAFITSNYLIANGYIERRLKPVKPGHNLEGMKRNWSNTDGLTTLHRSWLREAKR